MGSLLWEIVRQSGEPMVLVGADGQVLGFTRAFAHLVGGGQVLSPAPACHRVIRAAPAGEAHPNCCLEAVATDYGGRGARLWRVKRADGREVPVLVQPVPVHVGGAAAFLLLRVQPLRLSAAQDGPLGRAFLSAMDMCQGQIGPDGFRAHFASWARRLASAPFSLWCSFRPAGELLWQAVSGILPPGVTPARVAAAVARLLPDAPGDYPFDMYLPGAQRHHLVHVFPAAPPAKGLHLALVLGEAGLDLVQVAQLQMAVRAAALAAVVEQGRTAASAPCAAAFLSPREREIATLVARGYSDRDIAARLHLSAHTVKNHVRRVMEKLGVRRRTQMVAALAGAPTGTGALPPEALPER